MNLECRWCGKLTTQYWDANADRWKIADHGHCIGSGSTMLPSGQCEPNEKYRVAPFKQNVPEEEKVEPMTEGISDREKLIRTYGFSFDSDRDACRYLLGVIDTLRWDRKLLRDRESEREAKPEPEPKGRAEPSQAIRLSENFTKGFTSFDLKDGGRVHIPPEQVMRMWNEEQERKAKAKPSPESEKTEPHKGGDYHYSGDGSKQFWSRVNALSEKEMAAVYALGCDLQVMEEKVLKALYAAEMARPAPELGKDWAAPLSGAELIADERDRQIKQEGWSHEHDDTHEDFELSRAACCYANAAAGRLKGLDWPWDWKYWKPNNTPIRNLVKAGALIAAEIDRLQRLEKPDSSATPAPEEPKVCALCGSPAEYSPEEGVWRHDLKHSPIICDKYGYPIEVRAKGEKAAEEPKKRYRQGAGNPVEVIDK